MRPSAMRCPACGDREVLWETKCASGFTSSHKPLPPFSFTGDCSSDVIPMVKKMRTAACPTILRLFKQQVAALIFVPLLGALVSVCVGCSHFETAESASRPWVQNYEGYSTNYTFLKPGTVLYSK